MTRAIYFAFVVLLAAGGAKPETRLDDAVDLSHTWGSLATLYRRTGRVDLASKMEAKRCRGVHVPVDVMD